MCGKLSEWGDGEPQRVEAQVAGGAESSDPESRRHPVSGFPPP